MKAVAIYEAKARFSELLAAVQAGEEFEITKHGKPVARVVPAHDSEFERKIQQQQRVAKAIGKLHELRQGVILEGDIREIIAEGRM